MDDTPFPGSTAVHSVLVVDDMEANRAVLCRRLERYGYHVQSVEGGPQALSAIELQAPDIILLDYMMPQMNGIEVLRELRRNPRTQELPVIMVTARAESGATVEALEAGANDYVTKPIDFEVLKARIEAHLSKCTDASDLRRANAALDERVSLRSMTIADLEGELHNEIAQRRLLEQKLAERISVHSRAMDCGALREEVEAIEGKFTIVFEALMAGRSPNFAHMASIRAMLSSLKAKLDS
ncbi:response regulator [Novosphingobium sp. RD2P27]|uniref:Response regulator n=1 Tax=Novosphingobium kalidii TaxID=3230299 RepID=A0ABV2D3B3_9SPHN